MKLTILYCIAAALWLIGSVAHAELRVSIVYSTGAPYATTAIHIKEKLDAFPEISADFFSLKKFREQHDGEKSNTDIVVAIGSPTTRFLAQNNVEAFVLAAFVTEASFIDASSSLTKTALGFNAIYIDQPLDRYLALTRQLLPHAKQLATLGPEIVRDAGTPLESLIAHARRCDFSIVSDTLGQASNPIRVLNSLLENSDGFLVIPQLSTINGSSAKWILHSAARQKKPVIAFSERFLSAGAAASLYASNQDIAADVVDELLLWERTELPETNFIRAGNHFTVKINPSVMRFLGMKNFNDEALHENVRKLSCMPEGPK